MQSLKHYLRAAYRHLPGAARLDEFAASGCTGILQKIVCRHLPASVRQWRFVQCSYSQCAEDLLVLHALDYLKKTEVGYYVDVGAYDPVQYSNTLRLHQRGWRGINIDAMPQNLAPFHTARPEDINLNLAVGPNTGTAEFLSYQSGTTGRLRDSAGSDLKSILGEELKEVIQVSTAPLSKILKEHHPKAVPFGFLSVDCEGAELEVLRSNDWAMFRPWVIAVEDHAVAHRSELDSFCELNRYKLFSIAFITKIFVDADLC